MSDDPSIDYLAKSYTTFQLLEAARVKVEGYRSAGEVVVAGISVAAKAARNWSLAITAIEDAQMRTTRGHAIAQDKFAPTDLEKS
jgi:hypothetical protein